MVLTGFLVASCGQSKTFIRVANCPAVGIVAHMGTLTRFNSAGQTNENVIFDAVITNLEFDCDDQTAVDTTISFSIQARRGPAMGNEVQNLTYYVVVIRDNYMVTAKQKFTTRLNFSGGRDKAGVRETVVQRFTDFKMLKRYDYEVFVGFELAPEEFQFNVTR
jgi:hypothetical protein